MTDPSEERQAAEAPRYPQDVTSPNPAQLLGPGMGETSQSMTQNLAAHLPDPDPRAEINDKTGWVYDPGQALANLRRAEKAEADLLTARELLQQLYDSQFSMAIVDSRFALSWRERVRAYLAEQK